MTVKALPLTVWMNFPSFYQLDLFQALLDTGQVELQVIFAHSVTQERLKLGWEADYDPQKYIFLNERAPVPNAVRLAWAQRRRLHIVNGIWAEPAFAAALGVLRASGSRFAVYAESPGPRAGNTAFKSRLKQAVKQQFGGWVAHTRRASLLAISHFSREFYVALGFDAERVYDFGYFEAAYHGPLVTHKQEKPDIELIFVGAFIERKGVDVLLNAALPLLTGYPYLSLTLVGDGPERPNLEQRVRDSGCANRVHFAGVLPSSQVRARIAQADALVLPSRWDGWGMVVNEALSVGVPAIVSDSCGSADLLQHGVNGYVFRSEDVDDLRNCLRRFMARPEERARLGSAAFKTGEAISTQVVACYLVECLRHMKGERSDKPLPPWANLDLTEHAPA